ncbi:hypothetical protein EBR56_08950 [bacterium]|nr:hypothetical protein [bacterium]
MTLVVGTDEAGYGPNLGPLVVAATAWRLAGHPATADGVFAAVAEAAGNVGSTPLWADSKTIHRGGAGFAALERGVHAALALVHDEPVHDWPRLAATVGAIGPATHAAQGWTWLDALPLPRAADPQACAAAATTARIALESVGLELLGVACRAVYPQEFNRLLDRGLNKSDILSQTTLDLAAEIAARFGPDDTLVWCDRHGGRKSYGPLVARHFSLPLVRPIEETATRSAYVTPRLTVEFCVGGEARTPVALASMAAKYVRELAMEAFNDFWAERMPGLAPTAGYPVDAKRWRTEAAAAVAAARIPADDLWRRA